jgi:ATP-dependent Clp protease protease subunit
MTQKTIRKRTVRRTKANIDSETSDFHVESSNSHDDTSRTVYLIGEIESELVKDVTEKIITFSERDVKRPITMIINTGGGSIDDTFMLYDLMKFVPTPIHTVGLGRVMSAGCLLLAAGQKQKRKLGRNARFMYHCGMEEAVGSIFQIESTLNAFKKLEHQYDECFAFETGLTCAEVENLYQKNGPTADRYITPQEALRLGIVDILI